MIRPDTAAPDTAHSEGDDARPMVSVVIPSIGAARAVDGTERVLVLDCVRSVVATHGTVDLEIVVVAGPEMPDMVLDELARVEPGGIVRTVHCSGPFNFSASVDLGAAHARGSHLLFLNDDTEVVSADWLVRLLAALDEPAEMPDGRLCRTGAVGARLLFADGTLQHAGHTYRTSLDHVAFGLPGDRAGRDGVLTRRRAVAGVTAACLLTTAEVFDLVGGFSTVFAGNYNDVDLCLKIRAAGLAVVYEPAAVLHHYESQSRVATIRHEEIEAIQRRWLGWLVADPFSPVAV